MKFTEDMILEDAGVVYSFTPHIGYTQCQYTCLHILSGATFKKTAYISGADYTKYKLMNYWNRRGDWKYYI